MLHLIPAICCQIFMARRAWFPTSSQRSWLCCFFAMTIDAVVRSLWVCSVSPDHYTFLIKFISDRYSVVAKGDCLLVQDVCPHALELRWAHQAPLIVVHIDAGTVHQQKVPVSTEISVLSCLARMQQKRISQIEGNWRWDVKMRGHISYINCGKQNTKRVAWKLENKGSRTANWSQLCTCTGHWPLRLDYECYATFLQIKDHRSVPVLYTEKNQHSAVLMFSKQL